MQQWWTLQVKNFGRIKQAKIKIAPLIIFTGKNNTGKSYMASLLWGIMNYNYQELFPKKIPSDRLYKECKDFFVSHYNDKKERLDKNFISSLFSLYNTFLQKKKDVIVRELFSSNDLKIEYLSIDINENDIICSPIHWSESEDYLGFNGCQFLYDSSAKFTDKDIYHFIKDLIYMLLFEKFRHSVYLPASRTGFMLSYKTLTANLMETWGIDKRVKSHFSLPIIRFLQDLTYAEVDDERTVETKIVSIAKLLEKEILEGVVRQFPKPGGGFYYLPDLTKKSLPFHITSSLVSELAPLIIFLKNRNKGFISYDSIIFEEPESHLHLSAQRFLAKCLVKLINNHMAVCLTTHSDIFFQQINNLTASNKEKRKILEKLYKKDEIINPKDISVYQFNITDEGLSEAVPMELKENGFIIPTFNETIWKLSQESIELETDMENAE